MAVLEQLYRYTPLEESFSINNVALVDGGPRTLGLLDLMRVYIGHRIEVVTRRTRYRLARREERLHLVEGLLIAILDIDRVIAIIRGSDDTDAARTGLMAAFAPQPGAGRLHPRAAAAPPHPVLHHRARVGGAAAARRDRAAARRCSPTRSASAQVVSDELGQAVRAVRHPAPHPADGGDAVPPPKSVEGAADLRDPGRRLPRAALDERPRGARRPAGAAARSSGRAAASRARRDRVRGRRHEPRRARRGHEPRPPRPVHPGRPARGARRLGAAGRGHADRRLPGARRRRSGCSRSCALDGDPIALGTATGVVKRVAMGPWPNKPAFEIIVAQAGRRGRRRRARPRGREPRVHRLRRPAAALPGGRRAAAGRGRRRHGGHLAERRREGDRLRGRRRGDRVVATVSATDGDRRGPRAGRGKVTSLLDFPAKGRATGGVRAQTLGRGETGVRVAWVGPAPVLAAGHGRRRAAVPGRRGARATPRAAARERRRGVRHRPALTAPCRASRLAVRMRIVTPLAHAQLGAPHVLGDAVRATPPAATRRCGRGSACSSSA